MDETTHHALTESAPVSAPDTRTASLNSSNDHNIHDLQNMGVYLPRPAYQRPMSYGQKSPSNCTHCGNLTPRYGSTTVYGTPLGHTPATSSEQVNKFTYRHAKVGLSSNPWDIIISMIPLDDGHEVTGADTTLGCKCYERQVREISRDQR